MASIYDIVRRPRITEKGSQMAEAAPKVVFEVATSANKEQIRQAVQRLFNVHVLRVNTEVLRGKWKRVGRHVGKRPNWKKAIVTLRKGEKIDFFGTGAGT